MIYLKGSDDQSKNEYSELKRWSLALVEPKKMIPCKEWLEKTDFARVSFSERSISIKDTTFVYESNHAFKQMLPTDLQ